MRPRHSEAMETLDLVQEAFPAFSGQSLGIVVEADTDDEMLARLTEARQRITKAHHAGMLPTFNWSAFSVSERLELSNG